MNGDEYRDSSCDSYSRADSISLFEKRDIAEEGIATVKNINCYSVGSIEEDGVKIPIISGNCDVFSAGEHFDVKQTMKQRGNGTGFFQSITIHWYSDVTPPEIYMLDIDYSRTVNKLYEENECPRCGGENWYVGVFEDGNINPSSVSGGNKLIQSFLKYIYTKKLDTGYGSRITSIPGKYNMNDSDIINMAVQTELMSFKDYYTDKISTAILNGHKIDDSERLVSQTVSNIEIDEQNRAIKVVVTFGTKDGTLSSVNLMVANL